MIVAHRGPWDINFVTSKLFRLPYLIDAADALETSVRFFHDVFQKLILLFLGRC